MRPARRRARRRALDVVLVLMAGLVLLTGITVVKVLPLRSRLPTSTAFSRHAGAEPIAPVDAEAVSPWLFVAVIASEDQAFATHRGIDAAVTRDLAVDALGGERTRGGSTISQQLARNLWLSADRSWLRKGVEAWLALGLDRLLSKARELELYVNVVDWGDGAYGICHAAWRFFGVAPSALTLEQASLLVTALPDPARRDPGSPDEFHQDLAAALQIRVQATVGYHDTQVLEDLDLVPSRSRERAEHPCDRPPGGTG